MTTVDITLSNGRNPSKESWDILLPSYFRLSMTHLTSIKLFIESLGDEWLLNLEKWQK
jgi:hypothetical protein